MLAHEPTHHQNKIVRVVDPDHVLPSAHGENARLGRGRHELASGVEPPEESVTGVGRTRRREIAEPLLGDKSPSIPRSTTEHQLTDARVVAARNEQSAAPMPTTGHRLHRLAVDLNYRVAIAAPRPRVGC